MKQPHAFLFAVLLATLAARPGVAATVQNANDAAATEQPAPANVQYILFNRATRQGMDDRFPETLGRKNFEEVLARFPNRPAARVQSGLSYVFSPLRTLPETTLRALKTFLETAELTETPILVQIDLENWWAATEWLLQGDRDSAAWRSALANTLSDPHCRYVCIFNWEKIRDRPAGLIAITELIEAGGRKGSGP